MAKLYAFFPIRRTMCGLSFYRLGGQHIVRRKSSLSARRVKTSAAFAHTRRHADILQQGSAIASVVYRLLPQDWRQFWMFRSFTGEAIQLLKEGLTKEAIINRLKKLYADDIVKVYEEKRRVSGRIRKEMPVKRPYQKKNQLYWTTKTAGATKRAAQKQKLMHNAGLLAKAARISSTVYTSLPVSKRKHPLYRLLTGLAMRLLKKEVPEKEVRMLLKTEAGHRMPEPGSFRISQKTNNKAQMPISEKVRLYIPSPGMRSFTGFPHVPSASTRKKPKKRWPVLPP